MTKVAVYGTLKRGFSNHHLLEKAMYIGEAQTGLPFRLYTVGFPVLLPGTKDDPGTPVRVELYDVTAEQLHWLDRLEGNGRMYQRERRRFRTSSGGVGYSVRAWVYIGKCFAIDRMTRVEPKGPVNSWTGQKPVWKERL